MATTTETTTPTATEIKAWVETVYQELQTRKIHPSGTFDKGRRFYAKNTHLIDVRSPSRAYPFSHMIACRAKKYVKRVAEYYQVQSLEQLRDLV